MTTTFQPARKISGSNQTTVNVDRDGKPFGQLWTFKGKDETHGWHAKTLNGDYVYFDIPANATMSNKIGALARARMWMEDQ